MLPVIVVNKALSPVIVAPLICVVNIPLADVIVPVTVKPLTERVVTLSDGVDTFWKLPLVALSVVPVIVVPVNEAKLPPVAVTVYPLI